MHIALFLHDLSAGGSQRRTLTLAAGFAKRGHRVELVVMRAEGPLARELPDTLSLIALKSRLLDLTNGKLRLGRRLQLIIGIPALARYLRTAHPDLLLSAASHANVPASWAHLLARSSTALVLRVSNHYSASVGGGSGNATDQRARVRRWLFPRADAVIAVSDAVAEDTRRVTGLPRERITTIYNPMFTEALLERAKEPVTHPWLEDRDVPVILGAGRLSAQKDFPTLLRAFAKVLEQRPARLLILGDSKQSTSRDELLQLAAELEVADDVDLPGFVTNPLAYMARASVFALSSAWEGLPGVLIEAMACGCPVVSTDCPGGSREILNDGRAGPLVPVGDADALAKAILALIEAPTPRDVLLARATDFDVDRAVESYLQLFAQAVARRRGDGPST